MQLVPATAPIEIIAPGEGVDVYLRRSPLRSEREHLCVPACLSIEEIIDRCDIEPSRLYVAINGHSIEQKNWNRVRVKPGASVTIVKVPGKGALRAIAGLVVALFAAVVAPWLVGALLPGLVGTTAGAVATGLIGAGISIAGSLVVNALFPVAKPSSLPNTTTLYSIGGAQNSAAQYGSIPEIFGTHRISPPYAAGAYTELVGDDQYLRMLFVVGYGPIAVSDIKIGETAISKFDDVTYQVLEDHTVTPPTLYTKPVYQEDVSIELDAGTGWVQRTTADNIDELSVDVSAPSGIYRLKAKDGKRVNYTVTIDVQYKLSSSGTWLPFGTFDLTANSPQALRRTQRLAVARGKYDVRLSKSSSDYSGKDTVGETVYWTAVRGRRNEPVISFPKPLTLIAMRIRATGQLNGTVNTLNCIASPKIRKWSGATWLSGQFTRNPADHFRQVLQGNGNARPVDDAAIDLESLQEWHDYCAANGFTFDLVANEPKSVYERLTEIAAAGRAAVSFRDGRWGVVWDVADSPIVQHFTPRNSSNFSSVRAFADLPHGFRVSFINRDNGYLNDERVVYDDGYTEDNATKFEGIDFSGVTDKDLIWKHGRYHLAQLRLQRETYSLDTDFEHLVCTRGDRVRVNHDVVLWGAGAARVRSVSAAPDGVVLDDLLTMQAGKTYSMRFRAADGSSISRTITGADGEFNSFQFSDTGDLPVPGDLAMFGENGFESVVLRVKSITARQDLSARLELVDDAPGILQADTGTIPEFQTGIAPVPDYRASAPTGFSYAETLWTTSPATSTIDMAWQAPDVGAVASYIVQYKVAGDTQWFTASSVSAPSIRLVDLATGVYDVRIRAVFANGELSGFLVGSFVCAIFAANPADIEDFRISVSGDVATLQWSMVADQATSHCEIRFSPATTGVTWQTASQLRTNILGSQVQVSAMVGTYLIKAVNYAGLQSLNAALIVSTVNPLTSFNAVEEMQDAPDFPGVKTDVAAVGGQLRLENIGDVFDLADFFEVPDYFLFGGGFPSDGLYEFANIIDLGDIYTSRVSAEVLAYGELTSEDVFSLQDWFGSDEFFGTALESLWDVSVEISTTNDDPSGAPTWSDWTELVTADISARGYRFRVLLQSLQFDVTPVISGLAVKVDMPDRVIAENDLVVSTGGLVINFTPPYFVLSGVSISAQGLQTGDYYEITAKDADGFSIIFRNAAGSPVTRTFDYVAKGYGSVQ
ncbi:host specificity factor TipJ family phage tail protein [Rhizobium sp. CBN3]|uniref:host specificity factor TipJ family phage tail protein n=1 Tax=Rhizobium sp. CBN3 TaxID=3058045 RepID=UPI002672B362|nr:host specificity factor TipJ family phage tail protein [Rhizobium sp. CBN3]MDO3431198.1 host specificity factor TipJ family phage tail protein [Rhizobium sp. CBN3]